MKAGIKKQEVKFIVTDEYREWIALIKDRIRNSQIKASIKVNRELLELYWHIGEDIVNRQKHSKAETITFSFFNSLIIASRLSCKS